MIASGLRAPRARAPRARRHARRRRRRGRARRDVGEPEHGAVVAGPVLAVVAAVREAHEPADTEEWKELKKAERQKNERQKREGRGGGWIDDENRRARSAAATAASATTTARPKDPRARARTSRGSHRNGDRGGSPSGARLVSVECVAVGHPLVGVDHGRFRIRAFAPRRDDRVAARVGAEVDGDEELVGGRLLSNLSPPRGEGRDEGCESVRGSQRAASGGDARLRSGEPRSSDLKEIKSVATRLLSDVERAAGF